MTVCCCYCCCCVSSSPIQARSKVGASIWPVLFRNIFVALKYYYWCCSLYLFTTKINRIPERSFRIFMCHCFCPRDVFVFTVTFTSEFGSRRVHHAFVFTQYYSVLVLLLLLLWCHKQVRIVCIVIFRGARGFADPRPHKLRLGLSRHGQNHASRLLENLQVDDGIVEIVSCYYGGLLLLFRICKGYCRG